MQNTPKCIINKRFLRNYRLVKSYQFDNVYNNGLKLTSTCFNMYFNNNELLYSRLGISIQKKIVKHAVDRNYFKRIIREYFRIIKDNIGNKDVIVIVKFAINNINIMKMHSNLKFIFNTLININNKK